MGWATGAWASGAWAGTAWATGEAGAVAVVTGTAAGGLTEAEVVAGGDTIIVTLTDDTWVASGATFDAQRQAIIDGISADLSPTNGWNNEVRDTINVTTVARTSDTIVTVTLPAIAAYDISSNERITVTVPASALTGAEAIVATPSFAIRAAGGNIGGGYGRGGRMSRGSLSRGRYLG
jgi:hypothetical protein